MLLLPGHFAREMLQRRLWGLLAINLWLLLSSVATAILLTMSEGGEIRPG